MQQSMERSPEIRQPYLHFARQEIWDALPERQRAHCQELLAELLTHVMRSEQQRRSDHER